MTATDNHKFFTPSGLVELKDLKAAIHDNKIDVVLALTQAALRGAQGRARGAGRPVRAVYRRRYEEQRAAGAVR